MQYGCSPIQTMAYLTQQVRGEKSCDSDVSIDYGDGKHEVKHGKMLQWMKSSIDTVLQQIKVEFDTTVIKWTKAAIDTI